MCTELVDVFSCGHVQRAGILPCQLKRLAAERGRHDFRCAVDSEMNHRASKCRACRDAAAAAANKPPLDRLQRRFR
jgi:hypothetical protein